MAQRFDEAGIPARAVSAETSASDRREHLPRCAPRDQHPLRGRPLQRRPRHSRGRHRAIPAPHRERHRFPAAAGPRSADRGKTVLTALDFVGHQRREFRFDQRFRSDDGTRPASADASVGAGLPVPAVRAARSCSTRSSRELVLENIRQQVAPRWAALVSEVVHIRTIVLASYLDASGRGSGRRLKETIGRGRLCAAMRASSIRRPWPVEAGNSQTRSRCRTRRRPSTVDGLPVYPRKATLTWTAPSSRAFAEMLFYSLNPSGGGFGSAAAGPMRSKAKWSLMSCAR